jgi:hypothetical protein
MREGVEPLAIKIAKELRELSHPGRCSCGGCTAIINLMAEVIDRVMTEDRNKNENLRSIQTKR